MLRKSTCLIEIAVNLEDMEISGCDNQLDFPIFKCRVKVLLRDCDSFEESHIWHRKLCIHKLFSQIHKLHLDNFKFAHSSYPLKVDEENTKPQLSESKSINITLVGKN